MFSRCLFEVLCQVVHNVAKRWIPPWKPRSRGWISPRELCLTHTLLVRSSLMCENHIYAESPQSNYSEAKDRSISSEVAGSNSWLKSDRQQYRSRDPWSRKWRNCWAKWRHRTQQLTVVQGGCRKKPPLFCT